MLKDFLEKEKCLALLSILYFNFHFEDPVDLMRYKYFPCINFKQKAVNKDTNTSNENSNCPPESMPSAIESNLSPGDDTHSLSSMDCADDACSTEDACIVLKIVVPDLAQVSSVDFNKPLTELCVAYNNLAVFVYPVDEDPCCQEFRDIHMTHEFAKKHDIPGNVSVVKYVRNEPFLLASSSKDVHLVNTKTNELKRFKTAHRKDIIDIDISSRTGPRYFATASKDSTCVLWRIDYPHALNLYSYYKKVAVNAVRFHPNGLYVATGSDDGSLHLYTTEYAIGLRVYMDKKKSPVQTMTFSPDGKLLISADKSGILSVWDVASSLKTSALHIRNHETSESREYCVNSLSFHLDNDVAVCLNDGTVKIYDLRYPTEKFTSMSFDGTYPLLLKYSNFGLGTMVLSKRSRFKK